MMRTRLYWLDQIQKTDDLVERLTSTRPQYFRPPMGVRTWHITAAARAHSKQVITWTHRAHDGSPTTSRAIVQRLTHNLRPGAILLLHDGIDPHKSRDPRPTIEALPQLLNHLRSRSITPTRLDDLLNS